MRTSSRAGSGPPRADAAPVRSGFGTVFLDRDGTINVKADEGHYVTRPEQVVLLAGAGDAVRRLNQAGVRVVLVTNQRCLATGLLSAAGYQAVAARVRDLLAGASAVLDAEYVCPHQRGTCTCRKPLPGLLYRAAADHPDLALDRAAIVGDAESDVAAGLAAGLTTVRLAVPPAVTAAHHSCPDLGSAVDWLLGGADAESGDPQAGSTSAAASASVGSVTGG